MNKVISLLAALTLILLSDAQEAPKKVLFIGNSYTYVNDLPSMIKQMGESTGDLMESEQVTPGSTSFRQHCTSTGAMDKIHQGGWDIVVLQGQSQEPSFPWSQFAEDTYPYACQLADAVHETDHDAEVMFYMTWGRKNGDSYNAQFFDSLATYEGMDDLLCARYTYMAQQNHASVSPVGKVWRKLRSDYPDIELYQSDESHPSLVGSYAAACTFYTMFFHKNPLLITVDFSLDPATAATVRETVKRVVFDSISQYSVSHTESITSPTNGRGRCLEVFPSPTRTHLTVTVNAPTEMTITDSRGSTVRRIQACGKTTISVEDLPAGLYFIKTEGKAAAKFVKLP